MTPGSYYDTAYAELMDAIYAWVWWQQTQAGREPVTASQVQDTQNWLDGVLAERLREEAVDRGV